MKTITEHIEDLEAINEFYEDVVIREAVAFIKSQGNDLHIKDNVCLQQGLLITELKAEIKQLKQK